jgi:hypothetical protein
MPAEAEAGRRQSRSGSRLLRAHPKGGPSDTGVRSEQAEQPGSRRRWRGVRRLWRPGITERFRLGITERLRYGIGERFRLGIAECLRLGIAERFRLGIAEPRSQPLTQPRLRRSLVPYARCRRGRV